MNIRKDIAISDTGFVFDPVTGESFSLNPIGVEILSLYSWLKRFAEGMIKGESDDK